MKNPLTSLCSMVCLLITAATAQAQAPAAAPVPAAQPTTEAATTFQRWDKNSDRTLSAAEFAAGWQEIQAANTLRNLHDNFVTKDVDGNGSLGPAEYLKLDLIQKAGPSAPPMAKFDTDKSQSLDFKEYVGLVGVLLKPNP
jgi:Ca2+-binding EF-hand superfamily protein